MPTRAGMQANHIEGSQLAETWVTLQPLGSARSDPVAQESWTTSSRPTKLEAANLSRLYCCDLGKASQPLMRAAKFAKRAFSRRASRFFPGGRVTASARAR